MLTVRMKASILLGVAVLELSSAYNCVRLIEIYTGLQQNSYIMGNYCQQQFENVPEGFSDESEFDRIHQTQIDPTHYNPPQAAAQSILEPRQQSSLDQQFLHTTIKRRPVRLITPALSEEYSDSAEPLPAPILTQLNYELYKSLALPDYSYPNFPLQQQHDFDNLESVDRRDQYGVKYLGEWKNNAPHGNGVLVSNTSKYIGQFRNGLKHFHGREIFSHEIYEGGYEDDRRKGKGVRYTSESTENGQFDGQYVGGPDSRISYQNNDWFEGTVRDGKYHGKKCKFYHAESQVMYDEATYEEGRLVWAQVTYPNGNSYQGEMKGESKHGKGVYRWANGTIYEGQYHMDLKHGEGYILTPQSDQPNARMIEKAVRFEYGVCKDEQESMTEDFGSEFPAQWK